MHTASNLCSVFPDTIICLPPKFINLEGKNNFLIGHHYFWCFEIKWNIFEKAGIKWGEGKKEIELAGRIQLKISFINIAISLYEQIYIPILILTAKPSWFNNLVFTLQLTCALRTFLRKGLCILLMMLCQTRPDTCTFYMPGFHLQGYNYF